MVESGENGFELVQEETPKDESKVKGGLARALVLSPEERSAIAKKAAEARWNSDLPKATHMGELKLSDEIILPCYVLENEVRVLARAGFVKAIGRKGKVKGGRRYDQEFQMPVFLTAENLKPFITEEIIRNSQPLMFTYNSLKIIGYRAEFLPQVCQVFLDAKEANALRPNQIHVAHACKILYRAFATVGIVGLVDEATGFQQDRGKAALQEIVSRYIRKELAAWVKRFPDEFYEQIYRLKGWKWQGMSKNRYSVVGKYTIDLVYERLAPDVLEKLEEMIPKDENGKRRARLHQGLSDEIGIPALSQHLFALITLAKANTSWERYYQMVNLSLPKRNSNLFLPFGEDETTLNS